MLADNTRCHLRGPKYRKRVGSCCIQVASTYPATGLRQTPISLPPHAILRYMERPRRVQSIRTAVKTSVPGAARLYHSYRSLHRSYRSWAYRHRPSARTELFTSIADRNHWGDPDSVSGTGSNLLQTATLRAELPKLWAELSISRLADIPCGDFHWMSTIVHHLDYYFGGDIAPGVVAAARTRSPPHCDFAVFDLMVDRFPAVDAILARDVLVHLSNRDATTALENICRSQASYLITTTFPDKPGKDILTGEWRPLNLSAPPFSLPAPLRLINEHCTEPGDYGDKSLGVWSLAELRQHLTTR